MDDALIKLSSLAVVILIVYWLISAGVRSGIKNSRADVPPPVPPYDPRKAYFPQATPRKVIDVAQIDSQLQLGSGRFKVTGVDRETRMDCSQVYTADNEANAKVKAELDGIVVTGVERLPFAIL